MQKNDVKVGRKYVIRPEHIHRNRVMEGSSGTVVKVLGIGTYSWKPGECGRHEVYLSDQHTRVRIWVRGTRPKGRYNPESETFDATLDYRDILMTEIEWNTKRAALAAEEKRVTAAIGVHQAAIEDEVRKFSGNGAKVDLNTYRKTVTMDVPHFRSMLPAAKRAAFDRYVKLASTPRDEVIC